MQRECTSLKNILQKLPALGKKLNVIQIAKLATDLCLGMNYLHMSGRVHRDMHPGNFLVSSDWTVKITDFGASGHIATMMSKLTSTKGAPLYQAPETEANIYRYSSDIWSFGILFSEMCMGHSFDDPKPATSLTEMNKIVDKTTSQMDEEQKSFLKQLKKAVGLCRLALALLRRETALRTIVALNNETNEIFGEIGRKCLMLESIEFGSKSRGTFSDYVCAFEHLQEIRKWNYAQSFPEPLHVFLALDPPKYPKDENNCLLQ
jgi:serine/threonine protein kinase